MKKLFLLACILVLIMSNSADGQTSWELLGNTATANDYLGTNNNFPLRFYTLGQQRMALSSAGRLSLGLPTSTRLVHIHGTGPILAEMGSQLPAPAGSESLIVITNTESGSTAWDGLRIGLVGNVAQVATLDKVRLDFVNNQSTISLKGDGKINFFNLGGSYDAKIGLKSTNENAFYIDNSSNQNGYALKIKVTDNSTQAFSLFNGPNGKFVLLGNGQVGIGTIAPDAAYMLDIAGKLRACEVRVNNPGWCDYVFASDYNLMPMSQLASFIRLNHHLPEMPSTQEVESQGGFDLAFMSTALLKRSEENTLYILQLEEKARSAAKELEEQKALTQSAQAETEALEKRLATLEAKFEALLQTTSPEKN